MIWESGYWKQELLRQANRIKRRKGLTRWSERSSAGLERDLMVGCYSVRKLIEAKKITDDLRDRQIKLRGYSWRGEPVTHMNWHKVDEKYDLSKPIGITKPVLWITNQIIHSYVFMLTFNSRDQVKSILFNSDLTRRDHLYELSLNAFISLFEEVGNNNPSSMHGFLNDKTGDWELKIGTSRQPGRSGAAVSGRDGAYGLIPF